MTRSAAVLSLLGVLASLAVGPGATPVRAGGTPDGAQDGRNAPPRVVAFSPAAAHPGDVLLIDAVFAGRRAPRVWVGGVRVRPRRVVAAAAAVADDAGRAVRRVRVRVPKRLRAGDHDVRIATRAGAAVAAKPIRVASCDAPPSGPADCGNIPESGADISVTGSGGFKDRIRLSSATPVYDAGAGKTTLSACGDDGQFHCFGMTLDVLAADLQVGPVPASFVSYYDGNTHLWSQEPAGTVQVVEASATRVAFCVEKVLTYGSATGGLPKTVTVKGYVVVSR